MIPDKPTFQRRKLGNMGGYPDTPGRRIPNKRSRNFFVGDVDGASPENDDDIVSGNINDDWYENDSDNSDNDDNVMDGETPETEIAPPIHRSPLMKVGAAQRQMGSEPSSGPVSSLKKKKDKMPEVASKMLVGITTKIPEHLHIRLKIHAIKVKMTLPQLLSVWIEENCPE